ncbi:hypothetical protein J4414_02605 [Candidatus Woesearchaeota archaeon]|nr:hypothetical protein [Candidatus Woesearchaeota archaeon]
MVKKSIYKKKLGDKKNYVALVEVNSKNYEKTNMGLIKYFTEEENIPGVYVTLNKPFDHVKKRLSDNGVDTTVIIFIDAVTKLANGSVEKTEDCLFIGSPEKMSDISIAMDQAVNALPGKEKFIFFDSLSILLLYNQPITVARFIHFLSNKIRLWGVKGIIISLRKKKDKELINELLQFCDIEMNIGGD